jgi:hypothetical protein
VYAVLLAYVDESYTSDRYYIAALIVPDTEASSLIRALDKIVDDAAWQYAGLDHRAELHAYDLVGGKGAWAPLKSLVRARIGIYGSAVQAVADHQCAIIVRGVNSQGLAARYGSRADSPHSVVMTHLIESIDRYAAKLQENALIIADEVDGQSEYRQALWTYQQGSTWGYRARKITRVIDTIHFAPSHASRLVQGADLIAYLYRRRATVTESDPRSENAWAALKERAVLKQIHFHCWHP